MLAVSSADDGDTRRAFWFDGDNAHSVEVHVVSHGDDDDIAATGDDDSGGGGSGAEGDGAWSVARLERYTAALHASAVGASHLNGSDALLDNHFGE